MLSPRIVLTDLDQRPEMSAAVRALLSAGGPGAHHLVAGLPTAMGLAASADHLRQCAGVLIALSRIDVVGALAICPYSETQLTWWGPATTGSARSGQIARLLADEARRAAREAGFTSLRVLCDARNRDHRRLLQGLGFAPWKDALLFERPLRGLATTDLMGVRTAVRADHAGVAAVLAEGFPDSDHCTPNLVQREEEGYRHYLLADGGEVVAAAAVQDPGAQAVERRAWLKLIAVRRSQRGRQFGNRLLHGVLAAEARLRMPGIGLEVLADNGTAIRLYRSCGFTQRLSASVMIAPL
jgi:ribosomal protein S18 acetylase RimI-like enzyme